MKNCLIICVLVAQVAIAQNKEPGGFYKELRFLSLGSPLTAGPKYGILIPPDGIPAGINRFQPGGPIGFFNSANKERDINFLFPDHMACLVPNPATIEKMPLAGAGYTGEHDRMPDLIPSPYPLPRSEFLKK